MCAAEIFTEIMKRGSSFCEEKKSKTYKMNCRKLVDLFLDLSLLVGSNVT